MQILLVHLECDTERLLLPVNHHTALQKIKHNVDQFRRQILHDFVELDVVVLDDLELIASLVAREATLLLERVVYFPFV